MTTDTRTAFLDELEALHAQATDCRLLPDEENDRRNAAQAELRRLKVTPRLLAAVRAAYALHVPLVNSPGRPPACPDCLGGIYADDPDEARSCGCWGLTTPICSSCADHHGEKRHPIQWPCPTVAALDEALGDGR